MSASNHSFLGPINFLPQLFLGLAFLTDCSGGGNGAATPPLQQAQNFMPLAQGNSWSYSGSLAYSLGIPVSVNGQQVYPYQGGCNATEYIYKDAQQDVFSIGQSISGVSGPTTIYPKPELFVKGVLVAGQTWTNTLDSGITQTVTVGSSGSITLNGTAYTSWPLTYHISGASDDSITYVAGIGPINLTDYCVSPPVQRTIIADGIASASV